VRVALTKLAVFLAFVLPGLPVVHAHMLNMTEIQINAAAKTDATVTVQIDLGQSGLMTPVSYWDAVRNSKPALESGDLYRALAALESGIKVMVDGRPRSLQLRDHHASAISLEAIENPLTPQMAEVRFALMGTKPTSDSTISISLDDALDVPWPCLVRVDSLAALPTSRLLTSGTRSSGDINLDDRRVASDDSFMVSAVLRLQAWLPSLTWLVVGIQHIIPKGFDHIVFILGLFFLSTKLSSLLLQVTAFTLAHSATLGLTILGYIAVPTHFVEPLIAASILYVAIDNLYSRQVVKWRLLVVTGFGLLHGLGFASALSELALPEGSMLSALLFFNLGVEIGQITVLLMAYVVFGWLQRWPLYRQRVAEPASLTIAGFGLYWLIKRLAY
jgi:hypothetical protein